MSTLAYIAPGNGPACIFQRTQKHSTIEGLQENASERKSKLTDGGVVSEVLADSRQVALHFDVLSEKATARSEQTRTSVRRST